jgi:hypothetical protein
MRLSDCGAVVICVALGVLTSNCTPSQAQDDGGMRSQAVEFYVAPEGSDDDPGTSQQPFRTIGKAASLAGPGTTVHVRSGTYSGVITTNASGTASARIAYISDVRWGAQIRGGGEVQNALWSNTGDYVDIVAFDIGVTSNCANQQGIGDAGRFVRIYRNRIHDINPCNEGGAAINFGSAAPEAPGTDSEAFDNIIDNIGDYEADPTMSSPEYGIAHGIYAPVARLRLTNNVISRVLGWGIQLNHYSTHNVVAHNVIVSAADGGIMNGSRDAGCETLLPFGNSNTLLFNNILVRNRVGIASETTGRCLVTGATYSHNLFYGNTVADFGRPLYGNVVGSMWGDPQFVNDTGNATTGDYHVRSTSPVADVGVGLSTRADDGDNTLSIANQ